MLVNLSFKIESFNTLIFILKDKKNNLPFYKNYLIHDLTLLQIIDYAVHNFNINDVVVYNQQYFFLFRTKLGRVIKAYIV